MKRSVFIFFCLLAARSFSQLSAPDLRCLEVLPNGNVLLTWIPPTGQTASFNSYEIYVSSLPGGPYASLAPAITSINTNTFIHTTTVSIAQSLYYYMVTKSGAGGTISSSNSDTLNTIHLNVLSPSGAVDLTLLYNNIHEPPLNSSSTTYTVNKEYPVGTWSVLGITPNIKYADTISVCNAKISYQVTLLDNSGCTSKSSIVTGTYTDTYRPGGRNGPYIDSISVLADGSTILAWEVPRDKDIIKYLIYYRNDPNAVVLPTATVIGRPSTSYIYPIPSANTQPVALFVAAIDSCSNDPGIYNLSPVTMYLTANYNHCSYQTQLNWNKYRALLGGILEYRIYFSSNGTDFTQVGSTTDTSFVHSGTSPGKNVCYFIRVINTPKTITASSNRACFFATQVSASNFLYTKTASVVDKNSVLLKFFIDTLKTSQGIEIFRSLDSSTFNTIGFIPFVKQQPQVTFIDNSNINTSAHSYFYKAMVKDSCGNLRSTSNVVRTVLLKVLDDQENIFSKHLSWNSYEGFGGGISGYTIYRVINEEVPGSPVGTAGSNATTFTDDIEDAAPQGAKVEYMVEAHEAPGNPFGFFETSNSNTAAVYMDGALYIPTAFAPSGHNKTWRPVTHFIDKSEYSVTVFDRWGHKVFDTSSDQVSWDGSNCIPDVYVYLVRYKTSTGEYKEVKGTVLMLE